MSHIILTVHVISSQNITNNSTLNLSRYGQGSRGNGSTCYSTVETLIQSFMNFAPGFKCSDASSLFKFIQYLMGYVDDNTIMYTMLPKYPLSIHSFTAKNVLHSWQRLI